MSFIDDTVGQYFKGHGCIYFCDSHVPNMGFWMTPVFGEKHGFTDKPPHRTNVSGAAIGRTFHMIWNHRAYDDERGPWFQSQHILSPEERAFMNELYDRGAIKE